MIVAIRVFAVSDSLKSLISAAHSIGLIVALFYSGTFNAVAIRKSTLAAIPAVLSGVHLMSASAPNNGLWFSLACVGAVMLHTTARPFITAIYEENYRPDRRGRLLSVGLMLSVLVSIGANTAFGAALDRDLSLYRFVFIAAGTAAILAGALFFLIPSGPPQRRGRNVFSSLRALLDDRKFGLIMLSWSIFGFANLWSTPIRMVYLAETERGLGLPPLTIILIMGLIPEGVRLIATPIWGYFFDKSRFVALRIVMCAILGTGIMLFFLTSNLIVIGVASAIISAGLSGTRTVWNIAVTKIAPRGRTQEYMSAHAFLGGVRGLVGPYIGFVFIGTFSMKQMGYFTLFLTVLSIAILVPLLRRDHSDSQVALE